MATRSVNSPVSNVAVTYPRSDRKALKRERETKIAAGRKPDDWEEYIGPNMSM